MNKNKRSSGKERNIYECFGFVSIELILGYYISKWIQELIIFANEGDEISSTLLIVVCAVTFFIMCYLIADFTGSKNG
jgi:hypothetical protein